MTADRPAMPASPRTGDILTATPAAHEMWKHLVDIGAGSDTATLVRLALQEARAEAAQQAAPLDVEALARAMEEVTGEDKDISLLWWPEQASGWMGQGTQRQFAERLAAEYARLAPAPKLPLPEPGHGRSREIEHRISEAMSKVAPAQQDQRDHGEILKRQAEKGVLRYTERDLAYVNDVTEPPAQARPADAALLDSPRFLAAVQAAFDAPGEWGPAQGYYRSDVQHFIDVLRAALAQQPTPAEGDA